MGVSVAMAVSQGVGGTDVGAAVVPSATVGLGGTEVTVSVGVDGTEVAVSVAVGGTEVAVSVGLSVAAGVGVSMGLWFSNERLAVWLGTD
jgi:hypothetical protein